MPTREEFRLELIRMFYEATQVGQITVDVLASELHERVGDYPGRNHRMPVCCGVMRDEMNDNDHVLAEPPSGQGATLRVRYRLPRLDAEPN
jgi:hypothetical protein